MSNSRPMYKKLVAEKNRRSSSDNLEDGLYIFPDGSVVNVIDAHHSVIGGDGDLASLTDVDMASTVEPNDLLMFSAGLNAWTNMPADEILPANLVTVWESEEDYITGDTVLYEHKIYACRFNNADAIFDAGNWDVLLGNAIYGTSGSNSIIEITDTGNANIVSTNISLRSESVDISSLDQVAVHSSQVNINTDTYSVSNVDGNIDILTGTITGVNIGGNEQHPSAKLQVDSVSQGFLPPRLTVDQYTSIENPALGLSVYDTVNNSIAVYQGGDPVNGWALAYGLAAFSHGFIGTLTKPNTTPTVLTKIGFDSAAFEIIKGDYYTQTDLDKNISATIDGKFTYIGTSRPLDAREVSVSIVVSGASNDGIALAIYKNDLPISVPGVSEVRRTTAQGVTARTVTTFNNADVLTFKIAQVDGVVPEPITVMFLEIIIK